MMRPELAALWNEVDDCDECKKLGNRLQHILGGGKEHNPQIMFVFINPTARNITSKTNYVGKRVPHIGTKEIWKTFIAARLLDDKILDKNYDAEFVYNKVAEKGFYFTNLVKCTKENAELPKMKLVNDKIELLYKEIDIVKTKLIVAFGTLPFQSLTGQKLKLSDHFKEQIKSKKLLLYKTKEFFGKKYNIWPCYFPVGRGRRKEALELLKILKDSVK